MPEVQQPDPQWTTVRKLPEQQTLEELHRKGKEGATQTSNRKISHDCHVKEYFESRLHAIEDEIDLKVNALKEATTIDRLSMDNRLVGMNEFRNALADQSRMQFTRVEFEQYAKKVDEDIRSLRESRSELTGKASQQSVIIAYVLTIIGFAMSVILHFV